MPEERPVLQEALDVVAEEQAELRREIEGFSRFRDAVSHTFPAETDHTGPNPTAQLTEKYKETVLAASNHRAGTDDALERSLEQEFSEGIADVFQPQTTYTYRLKRKLLVQTSAAIDQRQRFYEDLEREADFLETAAADLRDITTKTAALPECAIQHALLEDLLETWEAYDELEKDCERLIAQRQRRLRDSSQCISLRGEEHALCRYLYRDLESTYPVMSAVASVCDQIQAARRGSTASRVTI